MSETSSEQTPTALPPPPPIQPHHGGFYAEKSKALDDVAPWIENAVHQALLYQRTVEHAVENAISVTKARLDRMRTTASAHFNQTLDLLQDVKLEYKVYEDVVVAKVKEGLLVSASHPFMTAGAVLSLGFLGLKGPRQLLYFRTMRLFMSEEALLNKADVRVKELKKSIGLMKAESEKLEKTASRAEEELIRGRTKLKQAGKQIQSIIHSAYKIERQSGGLKDILKELPRREASRFRSQNLEKTISDITALELSSNIRDESYLVSNLASEAKRERNALTKEVTKISNYGISV